MMRSDRGCQAFGFRPGVIVAARTENRDAADVSLSAGDVIHTVNGQPIGTVSELRTALNALKPRSPVVLQIERDGAFSFMAFELN